MKSIAVVTNSNSVLSRFLKENLNMIFGEHVCINNYYIDELKEDSVIDDDAILVMIKAKALQIQKHIRDSRKIIVVQRTIRENEIYKIFSIPKNTKVLVVNDDKETTLEMISLLYQLGVNHLNLIPYASNMDFSSIKIAITPGESSRVPENIESIIDVGHRCIDISTFVQLINMLELRDKEVSMNLIKYSESIITLYSGIKKQYKELFVKNEELDTVINLSSEGILTVDKEGYIELCNKSFREIFSTSSTFTGKKLDELFESEVLDALKRETVKDELIEYKDKFLNITKHCMEYMGENAGYCFNIQEVTYIKQLEQNLSKKLREKGQIAKYTFDYIKTNSEKMLESISLAKKIANSELTVLITGESGTGKELFAQSIHSASDRNKQPFVAVNCAAVPETLLESELFGYEGGAFTGALKDGKRGLFEQAHNGTIFLDEIGDMPLSLQARLLRVLQERQVMRIGSQRLINVNVRIIAATNKNFFDMVQKGEFREDLFYRLNVLPINILPLRKRKEDILLILEHFLKEKKDLQITEEVKNMLLNYEWPGNIRELQNVASYISLMSRDKIDFECLPYYLLNTKGEFNREVSAIQKRYDVKEIVGVMDLIIESNSMNKGMGRKTIEQALSSQGLFYTEGEIRSILHLLKELDFISSSVGRKGSEITKKGFEFVNWFKNRR